MPALEQNALYTIDEIQLEPSARNYRIPLVSDTVGVHATATVAQLNGHPLVNLPKPLAR